MDISFLMDEKKFNYRVCAIITNDNRILAVKDEVSPYYYLPGGRVHLGERAEDAVIREVKEELRIDSKIDRALWLNQSFFKEDVTKIDFHEICIYFLMDLNEEEKSKLLNRGDSFVLEEGKHTLNFEWLKFESLEDLYFYPNFIKKKIMNLPKTLEINTEIEG